MSGSSNATEERVTEAGGHILVSVDDVLGAGRRVEAAVVVQEAHLRLHKVRLLHTPCGDRERATRSEAARERHRLQVPLCLWSHCLCLAAEHDEPEQVRRRKAVDAVNAHYLHRVRTHDAFGVRAGRADALLSLRLQQRLNIERADRLVRRSRCVVRELESEELFCNTYTAAGTHAKYRSYRSCHVPNSGDLAIANYTDFKQRWKSSVYYNFNCVRNKQIVSNNWYNTHAASHIRKTLDHSKRTSSRSVNTMYSKQRSARRRHSFSIAICAK